jgi:hypothetical protein
MANAGQRLVSRVQERLRSVGPFEGGVTLTPGHMAELTDRVRHIRALGERFAGVRLSSYVTEGSATRAWARVGGVCVATEV